MKDKFLEPIKKNPYFVLIIGKPVSATTLIFCYIRTSDTEP